jgi:hypothetical protein
VQGETFLRSNVCRDCQLGDKVRQVEVLWQPEINRQRINRAFATAWTSLLAGVIVRFVLN